MKLEKTAIALLFGGFCASASAQQTDALLLSVEELSTDGTAIEAEIVETDHEERTLIVLMEDNDLAELIVPENAELVQMGPNNLAERPMEFSDLHAGDRIELEGVEIEGAIRLRIVGVE